jgi:polysaccharide pyruvyl transferase WcaK-like protein
LIYHVYANQSNAGDWLAARGIQRALSGNSVHECFCDEPFIEATLHTLASATPDDLIVIGGGGLFMDYFVPFWQGFARLADRVSYGLWGVGVCDLKLEPTLPPRDLIQDIVVKARFCCVRDKATQQWLSACNLPEPTGCPSLLELSLPLEHGRGILHVDNYTTAGVRVYEAMDAYAADWAQRTDRQLLRTNNRLHSQKAAELDRILNLYRKADIILSSALHGCILGAAMGRKVIAVSGDWKIDSFMQSVGLERWLCDVSEVDRVRDLLPAIEEQEHPRLAIEDIRKWNDSIGRNVLATYLNRLAASGSADSFALLRGAI